MHVRSLLFCVALLLLCSCSEGSLKMPSFPYSGSDSWLHPRKATPPCQADPCTPTDVRNVMIAISNYCIKVQGHYAYLGVNNSKTQIAIATIGTLAGTVGAPVAKGTASHVWSGLSGAANGIQATINQTFSTAVNVQDRVQIAQSYENQIGKSIGAIDSNAQVLELLELGAECRLEPARAELTALQAAVAPASAGTVPQKPVAGAAPASASTAPQKPVAGAAPASASTAPKKPVAGAK